MKAPQAPDIEAQELNSMIEDSMTDSIHQQPKESSNVHPNRLAQSSSTRLHKINITPKRLLIWRLSIIAIFIAFWIILAIDRKQYFFKELLYYLTQWGFMLTFAYFIATVIQRPETATKAQISGTLFISAFSIELSITIIYWIALFPSYDNKEGLRLVNAITFHSFPLVFLTVDFVINRLKYPLRQSIIFLSVFVGLYTINNIIISIGFDTEVYSIVDWVSLTSYLYYIGAILLMCIGYVSVYFGDRLKYKNNVVINEKDSSN